jgi:hypothetical protein
LFVVVILPLSNSSGVNRSGNLGGLIR